MGTSQIPNNSIESSGYVKREPKRAGNDLYGSKQWLQNQIIVIINTAMQGRPMKLIPERKQRNGTIIAEHVVPKLERNHALALNACMALSKLNGYIVEKRQSLAGRVDLNKLSPADLKATLDGALDQLSPGERIRITGILDGTAETIDEPEDFA